MNQSTTKSSIKFNQKPLKNYKVYALHKAQKNGEQCYVKVFDQKIITKYELDDALQFNIQVLVTQYLNFAYPNYFVPIQATWNQNQTVVFVTKPFGPTLDQFLLSNPQPENEALKIFEQILKAVYSIIMGGYWHRNLRAQHFVKVDGIWKLQSIVFEQKIGNSGINSEYLYNPEFQPPQAYERPNFTQQELDQRIVWDLGCIMIHILTGSHKLKNKKILEKFKDQPFSFKRLQAKIGDKLSPKLNQLLGLMCHYNQKKRIAIADLILCGFFSKEIAAHYSKNKQQKKQVIFVGSSSSISQAIQISRLGQDKPKLQGIEQIAGNISNKMVKQQQLMSASQKKDKLDRKQKFKQNINSIIQQDELSSSIIKRDNTTSLIPNMSQINNKKHNDIIDLYKTYLDKGDILGFSVKKFKQLPNLFKNKQKQGQQLVSLTQYAVKFVKAMDYCKLTKSMNQNKPIFDFSAQKFQDFQSSFQYRALKLIVNYKRKQALEDFKNIRQQLIQSYNNFIKQQQILKIFVQKSHPQQCQFVDIKSPYRKILKLSYDTIAECYTTNKTIQLARLGMYITYCLAIDKFYIPEEFQNNFKYFFAWSKKKPCNYVSLQQFQDYLDNAPRTDLVQNSRYIMQRFYEI